MKNNLDEFKLSKYNHQIELDGNLFLYNALSGGFCKINEDIKTILNDNCLLSNFHKLENLPLNIIEEFKKGGFLINKNIDEFKLIKSIHNISRFGNKNSLGLTLLPTMGCNFRCTYCFEKDTNYPDKIMNEEVMDAIINLIDDNLNDGGNLNISWFGGEPLVNFDIVKKLQTRINKLVDKKNLNLFAGMVTNGFLLTKQVSDELVSLRIKNLQITIDGPKEIHDQKRILKNGQGTFNKIIKNILEMNKNLELGIRINIEKDNISTMPEFLDFINKCGIGNMKNVSPYFAVVRDYDTDKNYLSNKCYSIKDFSKEEIALNKMAYEKGINIQSRLRPNLSVCGALSPNTYVIEPDGTIQKCWNSVGTKQHMVGHLLKTNIDLNLITQNQSEWYSWSHFENEECINCNVLPLCMGGCPYYTVNKNSLYDNNNYKCITQKFNLEDTLKLIAYKHLNNNYN